MTANRNSRCRFIQSATSLATHAIGSKHSPQESSGVELRRKLAKQNGGPFSDA